MGKGEGRNVVERLGERKGGGEREGEGKVECGEVEVESVRWRVRGGEEGKWGQRERWRVS